MNTRTRVIALIGIIAVATVGVLIRSYLVPGPSKLVPTRTTYSCKGGKVIVAAYTEGATKPAASPDMPPTPGGSVALTLSDGRSMTLAQTISADGVRYANPDDSFVFWSKGNGALVLENNEEKSYIGCIMVAPEPVGTPLPQVYSNSGDGFSLRLPGGYITDESYKYQNLGPGKEISGIKFVIPTATATGSNLSQDSYISAEEIPQTQDCNAILFLGGVAGGQAPIRTLVDGDTTYSVASSTGAGAGNRYEETVYALPGTNPCIALRYYIHYSVFENYPPGTVREFDRAALLAQFDAIRRTLVVVQ